MSKPIIAAKEPAVVNLEDGKDYYWCSCGRSASQPFCDGSHAGTDFVPEHFTVLESGEAGLCQCKHTKNPPFCDCSHAHLSDLVPIFASHEEAIKHHQASSW